MTAATTDPRVTPGAMEHTLTRELTDGTIIEFETAPRGWLTKKGEPRQTDWRAYHVTPPGGKRTRFPSVTTVLDGICPKDLTRWGEEHGIIGCFEAVKRGLLDPQTNTAEDAVERVRDAKLGADAARDRAATRGLNVHSVLERYMTSGEAPNPSDYLPEHRGFIRGLIGFLLDYDPEPVAVEHLVCHREHGYAGRLDLVGRMRSRALPSRELRVADLKTQPRLGIYESAHAQTRMYAMGYEDCDQVETDTPIVVVVAADGRYDVDDCSASRETVEAGLAWHRALKPISSGCMSRNRRLAKEAK